MSTEKIIDWVNEATYQRELSEHERNLRDRFILEYFVDYDYTAAAIRIGFPSILAKEYGQRFKYDAYVQSQIAKATGAEPHDKDGLDKIQRRRVIHNLNREANYKGPGASHSARVSALAKLSTIYGMEAPVHTKVTHEGGQEIKVTADFDFAKLTKEERALARKLIESQLPDADTTASA